MSKDSLLFFFLIVAVLVVVALIYIFKHNKRLKLPNVYLVTGAVKSGKTAISVGLARKEYLKNLKRAKVHNLFCRILRRKEVELPRLYSNIPLAYVSYTPLTKDILLRKYRIPNKSVVLLDEVSLVADSMLFKNNDINNTLTLFVKLFGHYSHGGSLIVNTQSMKDCHFAFKRCMALYLYVHSMRKGLFFLHYKVREMLYNPDNESSSNVVNNIDADVESTCVNVLMPKKSLKMYDCYCYSVFTDNLQYYIPSELHLRKNDSLKQPVLVTLQDYREGLTNINKSNKGVSSNVA